MPDLTLRGGAGSRIDAETEVRRSRFLTRLVRVEDEAAARAEVELARREHWDARHHCSAFVLGAEGTADRTLRSNDDGEPAGTAGAPMLDVLVGRGLVDVVAVVTRYFGGVLLGTGGLTRAYSDAVAAAVDDARLGDRLVQRRLRNRLRLALPHADAGRIESELRARGVTVLGVEYAELATLELATEPDALPALESAVAQLTAGGSQVQSAGEEWVDVALGPDEAAK